MKIKLGWKNGIRTPVDEYKYALGRGYNVSSKKDSVAIIDSLPKLPKGFEGFIPDKYFYGHSTKQRGIAKGRDRNEVELKEAFEYIKKMQANISMEMLLNKDLFRITKYYFFLCYLMELLSRNRNVDLILSEEMVYDVLDIFTYVEGFLHDNDTVETLIGHLEFCKVGLGEESYHVISRMLKKGDVFIIEFDTKQCVHQSVGYPFY